MTAANATTNPTEDAPHSRFSICLALPELGPQDSTGAGAGCRSLAIQLTAAGHDVTCLYIGPRNLSPAAWQSWVELYNHEGIHLFATPAISASELVGSGNLIKSYEIYHWLKRNDRFDIIHFPEQHGPGYHSLTAKRHGLAFARSRIYVGLNRLATLLKNAVEGAPSDLAEVDTNFMERRVVDMADALVNPAQPLSAWFTRARHGAVSHRPPTPEAEPAPVKLRLGINELVYFGPLESQKGLVLFCDALDYIPSDILAGVRKVVFLGQESIVDGLPSRNYLERRSRNWPFAVELIMGSVPGGPAAYLRDEKRLAIIPSLFETSPARVLECLVGGISFVASAVGAVPALIAGGDHAKVCFQPNSGALSAILCTILTEGYRPATPASTEEPPRAALAKRNTGAEPLQSEARHTWKTMRTGAPATTTEAPVQFAPA